MKKNYFRLPKERQREQKKHEIVDEIYASNTHDTGRVSKRTWMTGPRVRLYQLYFFPLFSYTLEYWCNLDDYKERRKKS